MFKRNFSKAEQILSADDKTDEIIEMYQVLHNWDQSLKVAESKNHPDLEELKANYIEWLI